MDNKKREQIISQIKKLQEIQSEGSGAFQGEISNAASMMQKLMDKYAISQMDIDSSREDDIEEAFVNVANDVVMFGILHWHLVLARLVAKVTHTRRFTDHGYNMNGVNKTFQDEYKRNRSGSKRVRYQHFVFFGQQTNAKIANELFTEWVTKIYTISQAAVEDHLKKRSEIVKKFKKAGLSKSDIKDLMENTEEGVDGRIYRKSWLDGCLEEMQKKVYEQEKQREPAVAEGLVIYQGKLDLEHEKANPNLVNRNSGGNSVYSSAGYKAGKEAGKNMNLAPTKNLNTGAKLLKG